MKLSILILPLIFLNFVGVGHAQEPVATQNAVNCESYEDYDECADEYYVGPDGVEYDDHGNPVQESDNAPYYDEPQENDSGYLNGGI